MGEYLADPSTYDEFHENSCATAGCNGDVGVDGDVWFCEHGHMGYIDDSGEIA